METKPSFYSKTTFMKFVCLITFNAVANPYEKTVTKCINKTNLRISEIWLSK